MPNTPTSNGRDWTSLRSWANAIGIVGIPGAIAIFLVYIGATEVPKLVRAVEQAVAETRTTRELMQEQHELTQQLIRMVQRTCSNTAKDDNARQRCFDK